MKFNLYLVLFILIPAFISAAPPKETPVLKVTKLYADHAGESVIDEPLGMTPSLTARPGSYLKRFLSPSLAALVLAEQKHTGEIGTLDFSPLWASQDPVGTSVRVTQGSTESLVHVELTYPGGTSIGLKFKMVAQGNQWLIDDIIYPNPPISLKGLLQGSPNPK